MYKQALQYRAYRGIKGINTAGYLIGIKNLVWTESKIYLIAIGPLSQKGKKKGKSETVTKETTFASVAWVINSRWN